MEKSATSAGKRAAVPILLILLLLGWMGSFSGCAGFGQPVPVENRILFTEKTSEKGVFSSGPLMVNFSYNLEGKTLHMTGTADYRGGYDSLNVYILFIDASGTILQRNIVYYSGYRVGFWPGGNEFQANLDAPANAAGFSFSYSAQPVTMRR